MGLYGIYAIFINFFWSMCCCEYGTQILLIHRCSNFLVYVLTKYMSLHSKFFMSFGIKVKALYTSINRLWYLISELRCLYFELFGRRVTRRCSCEYRDQLNQPAFSLTDCFYFLCLLKFLDSSTGMYPFMRTSSKRNMGFVKLL